MMSSTQPKSSRTKKRTAYRIQCYEPAKSLLLLFIMSVIVKKKCILLAHIGWKVPLPWLTTRCDGQKSKRSIFWTTTKFISSFKIQSDVTTWDFKFLGTNLIQRSKHPQFGTLLETVGCPCQRWFSYRVLQPRCGWSRRSFILLVRFRLDFFATKT